ncbi:hypothetical protein GYB22_03920 [bacterium]|nr:hypothetical protein [bacterium]
MKLKKYAFVLLFGIFLMACQSNDTETQEEEKEMEQVDDMVDRDQQRIDSMKKANGIE